MLAAAGQTRRADLHRAVEKLDQVGATILGIVLNKVTRQTGRDYGYDMGTATPTGPTGRGPTLWSWSTLTGTAG